MSVVDIGKNEKNIFLFQNDQFFTKGNEICRNFCILVILKGLHQLKLKKSFGNRETMRKLYYYKFIIYLAFKKSILKNYNINSYT